ncbi:MAG: cobalamin B12-binding domain-containing protein [Candidatus Omnitrophica bacterium]|nr:cobalamin B12-binding domain-containing protein [Candidatus Omnitrophota bacterium]
MSSKFKIGLVQINNSFAGQNYLPYTAGLLQAYAEENLPHPQDFQFLLPIYSRISVAEGVRQMDAADLVCFSVYVWNIKISLELAKRIKAKNPNTVILFGGPQVPDEPQAFLRQHPFIDLVCHGEGEKVFVSILTQLESGNWDTVPSVSYIDRNGLFRNNPKGERIRNVAAIPSPYLKGTFEKLIRAYPGEVWLALWETNRGCPFSCTFCDWGSATASQVFSFPMDRLQNDMQWFSSQKIEFIYCCDANFGLLNRDIDIVKYMANLKTNTGYPKAFSVQNTKNATDRAYRVQKILNDYGLNKGVTLSMQSVDPYTLQQVKRENISSDTYRTLQHRFSADGVPTYTDLILGLPGETYESFANGVGTVIQDGQHNRIQFNNLSILPNAEMGDPEYQKKYGFEIVETKIINIHGSLAETEEIHETQQLVIATNSMPQAQWRRTRAFSWMTALLHFDKLLQIPFILIHKNYGIPYRDLLEIFSELEPGNFPIMDFIRAFFIDKARQIQNGDAEYCNSEEWLNIWWPPDEYIFIKLCTENNLGAFYKEAEKLLCDFLQKRVPQFSPELAQEALSLNKYLIKLPFIENDLVLDQKFNTWEFYKSVLVGQNLALVPGGQSYRIHRSQETWSSWDQWCQKVIWYGNKRAAYIYNCSELTAEVHNAA